MKKIELLNIDKEIGTGVDQKFSRTNLSDAQKISIILIAAFYNFVESSINFLNNLDKISYIITRRYLQIDPQLKIENLHQNTL